MNRRAHTEDKETWSIAVDYPPHTAEHRKWHLLFAFFFAFLAAPFNYRIATSIAKREAEANRNEATTVRVRVRQQQWNSPFMMFSSFFHPRFGPLLRRSIRSDFIAL